MADCLFCKIITGDVPSEKVFETEKVLAFRDIRPQAPVHILIIPKEHIASAQQINASNSQAVADIAEVIPKIAEQEGISKQGYRIVSNIGFHGQQTVEHLHYHLLGGRQLGWPPG